MDLCLCPPQTFMQIRLPSRMRAARLMVALFALAGLLHVALSLRIAAFNIRTFGETKMSNATLSNYIVQVGLGRPVSEESQGWMWGNRPWEHWASRQS